MKTFSDQEVVAMAMKSGFMLSSGYGQGAMQAMPVSDTATLVAFAEAVVKRYREATHAQVTQPK